MSSIILLHIVIYWVERGFALVDNDPSPGRIFRLLAATSTRAMVRRGQRRGRRAARGMAG